MSSGTFISNLTSDSDRRHGRRDSRARTGGPGARGGGPERGGLPRHRTQRNQFAGESQFRVPLLIHNTIMTPLVPELKNRQGPPNFLSFPVLIFSLLTGVTAELKRTRGQDRSMGANTSACCSDLRGNGMNLECCMPNNGKQLRLMKSSQAQTSSRNNRPPKDGNTSPINTRSNSTEIIRNLGQESASSIASPKKRSQKSSAGGGESVSPTLDSDASTRDPPPMLGWTQKEQRALISELDKHPQARKHPDHLRVLFERTHRVIPNKSLEEIEECYKYVERSKIAFFGSKDSKALKRHASFPNS